MAAITQPRLPIRGRVSGDRQTNKRTDRQTNRWASPLRKGPCGGGFKI